MKKFKIIAFAGALVYAACSGSVANASTVASTVAPQAATPTAETVLTTLQGTPVTLEQALALNDLTDVSVSYTKTELNFGDVSYTINLGNSVLDNKSEAVQEFLDDLKNIHEDLTQATNFVGVEQVEAMQAKVAQSTIPITEITVIGPVSPDIAAANFVEVSTPSDYPQSGTQIPVKTAATCGNWTPNFINSLSGPHAVSGRTERITFRWTPTALAALKCTSSTTFEPDFVTYNYDGLSYLGDTFMSTVSNLPDPYLDTRIFDNPQEHVYTIGTPSNSKLVANFTYSNYMHLNNGNAASDTAKIVWQRGHNTGACLPALVTFCVFADASSIILAWQIPMPGSY
jgi:hypothetical protein